MTPWMDIAGWTLVHFVWQGTAAAAAISLYAIRAATPQARYAVASTALAIMLLSPLITAGWLSTSTVTSTFEDASSAIASGGSPSVSPHLGATAAVTPRVPAVAHGRFDVEPLFPVIVVGWLIGVALLLARLAGGW